MQRGMCRFLCHWHNIWNGDYEVQPGLRVRSGSSDW